MDLSGMDLSANSLLASLFVSTIGFSFYIYGKKQERLPQLGAGIALMVFPYFVSGALSMVGIAGGVLIGMYVAVRAGI